MNSIYNIQFNMDATKYKATTQTLMPYARTELAKSDTKNDIKTVLDISNEYRRAKGVAPLRNDSNLNIVAMVRAMEIAYSGKYSHYRPNGSCLGGQQASSVYKVVVTKPPKAYSIGENLTYGSTAKIAVEGWRSSPPHYNAIINSKYKSIGIGRYTFGERTYWVQIFLTS